MPHDDDFAILVTQQLDGLFDLNSNFALGCGSLRRHGWITQVSGKIHGGLIRGATFHWLLSVHVAFGADTVPPISIDDPIPRNLTQPKVERHHRIVQVFVQSPACFDHDVLDHIANINALLDFSVQSQLHQTVNGRTVFLQQTIDCIIVTALGGCQQLFGLIALGPNGLCHKSFPWSLCSY